MPPSKPSYEPLPAPAIGDTATSSAGGKIDSTSSAAVPPFVGEDSRAAGSRFLSLAAAAPPPSGGGSGVGAPACWICLSWPATAKISLSKDSASAVILSLSRALCLCVARAEGGGRGYL